VGVGRAARGGVKAAAIAVLLAVAATVALPGTERARAGTYELLACDAAPNHSFDAWQREAPTSNGTMAAYASWCDGNPGRVNDMETNGLISRADYDNRWTPRQEGQGWIMRPAPGTRVVGLTWAGTLRRPGALAGTEWWTARIADAGNGAAYLACPAGTGSCTYNQTAPQWLPLPAGAPGTGIEVGSYCMPALPQSCLNTWTSPYFNTASASLARIRYADVRVEDTAAPGVSFKDGGLTAGGWLRGRQGASYASSDNSGVRTDRVYVDGAQAGPDRTHDCDFTGSVPCPASASGSYDLDTGTLADGSHVLRAEAVDPAGNVASASTSFQVDNHAPAAPVGVSADGGGVSTVPRFTVRFANPPGQAAPIATVHYTACPAGSTGGCRSGAAAVSAGGSGEANAVTGSFGIADQGAYDVTLWLEDGAGNADPAQAAAPVRLQLGEDEPAPPQLAPPPSGWLTGASYTQRISFPPDASVPASGVAGYSVTTDGSTPDATVDAPGRDAAYSFAPAEGVTTLKARTLSGAGTPSPVAEVTLRTDRTPPATSVLGAGPPRVASDGPLDLTLLGTDQPGLSGMGGADPGDPVSAGGHVDYRLDGGPTVQVRGDEARVRVAEQGAHTIELRAYDVAQNASPVRTLTVTVGAPRQAPPRAHAGFWDASASTAAFAAAPGFASDCPPQTTLAAGAATTVDQSEPDRALAANTAVTVRSHEGDNARALLAFELPAIGDCAVLSAELRLRQDGGGAGRALAAYRLASEWSASSVTWDTRPGAAGSPATAVASGSGWQAFDVTEQVRAMYRSANDGIVVEDAAEGAAEPQEETFGGAELVVALG
jgi:hypothetical protein